MMVWSPTTAKAAPTLPAVASAAWPDGSLRGDGVFTVDSPAGGPTIVKAELPCG